MLQMVVELSDHDLATIDEEIRGQDCFEFGADRCSRIERATDLSAIDVEHLLLFLNFLYSETSRKASDDQGRNDLLEHLVASEWTGDEDLAPKLIERLLRLTAPNSQADFRLKAERLQTGFLPNAMSFSSFLDLRPIIDETRSKIEGFLTVVQFKIVAGNGDDETTTVIQLNEQSLESLAEAIKDAQAKMMLARSDEYFSSRIVKQ